MIDASATPMNMHCSRHVGMRPDHRPRRARRKILVVLHQENSSPGRIGRLLR